MTEPPMFPKPSDIRQPAPVVRHLRSGAEQCNLLTKAGRDEYIRRKRLMWERQGRMCCYHGHFDICPGKLNWSDAMFAHEVPCGHGGGSRDDRIEVNGKRLNGVAHARCNSLAGSRRIKFNAAHNKETNANGGKMPPRGF